MTRQRKDTKLKDLRRSSSSILFVPDGIQMLQRIFYQQSSASVWRPKNRRTSKCRTVKQADKLLLLTKEGTVPKGMFDRLIEIGTSYGMGANVRKSKVKRISQEPSPVEIMIYQKQLKSVEYLNYSRSMITNDVRCTRVIKSRIATAKAAFSRKKDSLHLQTGFEFKEEFSEMLHLERNILWC